MKGEGVFNFTQEDLNLLTFTEQELVAKLLSNAESLTEIEMKQAEAIFEKVRNAKD